MLLRSTNFRSQEAFTPFKKQECFEDSLVIDPCRFFHLNRAHLAGDVVFLGEADARFFAMISGLSMF